MALVLGVNSGFVTTAPTADPSGSLGEVDTWALVTRHTSPATAVKITEIGWWCGNATQETNFEVGLYAADGAVVPGEAGTLLQVSRTNAKGTTAGWKRVTGLNWSVSPNTSYWLGLQVDDTATTTGIDYKLSTGVGEDEISGQTTLPNPFGGGALADSTAMYAIYAVWEAAPDRIQKKLHTMSQFWG